MYMVKHSQYKKITYTLDLPSLGASEGYAREDLEDVGTMVSRLESHMKESQIKNMEPSKCSDKVITLTITSLSPDIILIDMPGIIPNPGAGQQDAAAAVKHINAKYAWMTDCVLIIVLKATENMPT
uniref:Dynamin-type G domain-containing protein n=1 Tax=Chromera velia CCMP2878 TaxID=1169474 RepID=A0A0G4F7Z4_9ALVE|eukprot:Cvel_15556.t1-p1 / transcript=Cvel_15556.t1 / gene=Cvel_15556 / organism=Chromera_velia_CCMP2878 / gene_product=hypothetical protein / transcript_product=hypothetical protein / location=Cvel_scaffold1156:35206-35580(+) / protein_length=125 / sequence_SO=supercontig / SO=protein_coding / is_pseudo=false